MSSLRLALLSTVCLAPVLGLITSPALAAKAGVTAAVNPQAVGTAPGAGVRTMVLGDDVLTNEKIDTTGGGLVQILLADGTTFTVGPNSSLVIDKFVYDPDANTAQVTASLAKGVFRFIGGRTSKTEGDVTINTPVGTVGIRGAVADINLTPDGKSLKAQIDLLFGKEVTLTGPGGLADRIYKAGYSIQIGSDGKPTLVKTPPGSANVIQTALAGKPGEHGGSGDSPSDGDVAGSDVPSSNSGQTPQDNAPQGTEPEFTPPDLAAIEMATIDFFDTHDNAQEILDGDDEGSLLPEGRYQFYSGGVTGLVIEGCEGSMRFADINGNDPSDNYIDFDGRGKPIGAAWSPASAEEYIAFGGGSSEMPIGALEGLQIGFGGAGNFAQMNRYGTDPIVGENVSTMLSSSASGCTCAFLSWGSWDTSFDAAEDMQHVTASGSWVAGRPETAGLFDTYLMGHPGLVASYSGSAVGTVINGSNQYVASGDMSLTFNFGPRTGTLSVTNFDTAHGDHDFSVPVTGLAVGPSFGGFYDAGEEEGGSFAAGTFVTDGSDPTAGVMGNFIHAESSYGAIGVFGGAKGPAPSL